MTDLFVSRIVSSADFTTLTNFTVSLLNSLAKSKDKYHHLIPLYLYQYLTKLKPLDYTAEQWANISDTKSFTYSLLDWNETRISTMPNYVLITNDTVSIFLLSKDISPELICQNFSSPNRRRFEKISGGFNSDLR